MCILASKSSKYKIKVYTTYEEYEMLVCGLPRDADAVVDVARCCWFGDVVVGSDLWVVPICGLLVAAC